MLFWKNLSFNTQLLIKVLIRCFIIVYPAYCFAYELQRQRANADIMARMHDGFGSDELKHKIKEYKERKEAGGVESY